MASHHASDHAHSSTVVVPVASPASQGERLSSCVDITLSFGIELIPCFNPGDHSWLGQNSKQQRLGRALTELQAKVRLATSGDRHEMRQTYLPTMFPLLTKPLIKNGAVSLLCFRVFWLQPNALES